MMRCVTLLAALCAGCTASNPSETPVNDASATDAAITDAQVVETDGSPPDMRVDPDAGAVDMGPAPDMRVGDMATTDMIPSDMDVAPDFGDCTPIDETCNAVDDDCDGRVDEGFGVGAPCAAGVGACAAAGVVMCEAGAAICAAPDGAPGPMPVDETCNGVDDDCDGATDEEIATEPCYTGPDGTADVGACQTGGSACVAGGVVCLEQVRPSAEACDGADADCDGQVDEGCADCGDGTLDPGEACDDGNRDAGDGCAPNCRLEGAQSGLIPGVQRDVPVASLADRGFFECYRDRYNSAGTPLDQVLGDCAGSELLIGCRPTGAPRLTVAAEGLFEEVTRDVGGGREAVNPHNGVHFYFSRSASWGFAPLGAGVFRNTCDTASPEDANRMCWHTSNDAFRAGWRCSDTTGLSGSGQFERVIYARTAVALGAQRGFGHHGECDSFNGCVDAATCAEAACRYDGLGAPVSWREGGCLSTPDLDCDLFASVPDDLDTDWVPGCDIPVAYDVVCAGAPPPVCGDGLVEGAEECDDGNPDAGDGCSPSCEEEVPIELLIGPQQDVSIGGLTLGGFAVCHTETYATRFDAAAVREACPGATWIVGCRRTNGGDSLTVAAMGVQATIFEPVPNERDGAQVHNSAQWYYGENYSFGFAPEGVGLNRNTCDTAGDQGELRLCWHTIDAGGWRCGATTQLNNSEAWERVILHTP